jgi:autotransporter passenger strand-loop-strand repeat protein
LSVVIRRRICGLQYVFGTATSTTVAGGYELVESGGSTLNLTIADNGAAAVLDGGAVDGATISSGTLDILSGAVVASGSPLSFAPGGGGSLLILNDSMHFGGLVAGFSSTAEMDLTDINYVAGTTTHNRLAGRSFRPARSVGAISR